MSTVYQIVYWRDIPAQVKARSDRVRATRQLDERFQVAIDQAAMRAGLSGSDVYLAEWRTSEGDEKDGEPEQVAATMAAQLEAAYSAERLAALAENGGRELI